jgi:hypothetical protein
MAYVQLVTRGCNLFRHSVTKQVVAVTAYTFILVISRKKSGRYTGFSGSLQYINANDETVP